MDIHVDFLKSKSFRLMNNCTVYPGLSVRKLTIIMVLLVHILRIKSLLLYFPTTKHISFIQLFYGKLGS